MSESKRAEIIESLWRDRRLAHRFVFTHEHESPPFHGEIIDRFHSQARYTCDIAFRGSAKSTLAEEALVLMGCFREFRHCLVTGATIEKAQERLHAMRRHFERNAQLRLLFGDLCGQPWSDDQLELTSGIAFQAMGRGQALRGTKTMESRPDMILVDDIEDKKSVATYEGMEKTQVWFFSELLPAGDVNCRVRVLCNDMGVESLGNRLKAPRSGFEVNVYPWLYKDELGVEQPLWPERYPMIVINRERDRMTAVGRLVEYHREYLCRSEVPEEKPFKRDQFRFESVYRTWHPVYVAYDPARTVNSGSADTGRVVWSWIANRMVIWDAWGKKLLPDQIIQSMLEDDSDFKPVLIGVDEVGLNEWLHQPLRHECARRGITLPLKALHPPVSKTERIRALQPFFAAREVVFTKALPDLESQLQAFPYGKRDVLDALAYALYMRPGEPMYADFTGQHVVEDMLVSTYHPTWLAAGASSSMVAFVLIQVVDGAIHVVGDWVREGEPLAVITDLVALANLEAGGVLRPVIPPHHFVQYHNTGLLQAFRRVPLEVRKGTPEQRGRAHIAGLLRQVRKGYPAFAVSSKARWTLSGMSGGYCRAVLKGSRLAESAEDNVYRLVIEAIESFAGLLSAGALTDGEGIESANYTTNDTGQRYISSRKI